MEVEAGQRQTEIEFLKACINDLNCIVALPAAWSGGTASRIVGTSLDVLRDMLRLDFIYARLRDPDGQAPIEMARVAQSDQQATEIASMLKRCLGNDPATWPARTQRSVAGADISIVTFQLGVQGEVGVVTAGSRRTDFPAQGERLLLSVAANQAMVGLQDARRLSEQQRVSDELDRRVAQRTAELAAANDELKSEIAERRLVEERLRTEERHAKRNETLLAEAQRLSSTGSFSWRVTSDDVTYSEQTYRIYEFEPGAPVTLGMIASRIHPEDMPLFNDTVDLARRSGADLECEYRLLMPDHSVKHLHLFARATRDQSGELEYIGAIQDVTERKLSEEALARARSELAKVAGATSLAVLTASIAHEVNQPLSGIITNASTCLRMLDTNPPNVDGARETAKRTIRDGNRAADVITHLRAMFGQTEFTVESLDLNEAAREVIAVSLNDLRRNRVVLQSELAEDLPTITGDRIQLQQVILNLLRNASDAMVGVDDRPRQLLIRTQRDDGDRVRVTVRDAGAGVDPASLDKLFDAFYTTKSDGMGIGLSVSRSIVERHHGRLWAAPNDGAGTTFSFSIPCAPESVAAPRVTGH